MRVKSPGNSDLAGDSESPRVGSLLGPLRRSIAACKSRHQYETNRGKLRIPTDRKQNKIASHTLQLDIAEDQAGRLDTGQFDALRAGRGLQNLEPLLL